MKSLALLTFLAGVSVGLSAQQAQVLVSAAASLTDVLSGLQAQAESAIGARVQFNFGGSGTLRHQIEEGAPVDVYFAAASEDMDRLEKGGFILSSTRRNILSNSMVLIGQADAAPVRRVEDLRALLLAAPLLAIGNPDTVPAGRYATQVLAYYGLSSVVARKLVLGGTVREVLQFVESGSASFGIVFATDALSVRDDRRVHEVFLFPADAVKTPILYPVAVVRASRNRDAAERMVEFLQGAAAREAFRAAGFILE